MKDSIDNMQGNPITDINWEELRKKYFYECVDKNPAPIVNMAPHDLFEWFKNEVLNQDRIMNEVTEEIIDDVVKEACVRYGIEVLEMRSKCKLHKLIMARHAIVFVLNHKNVDYNRIGKAINRTRSLIYRSVKTARDLYDTDYEFKEIVDKLL